jgi:SAM-dependent methyltransferase
MSRDWSPYVPVYDRVLCRTATYRSLLTDLLGRSGPLPRLRDGTVILDCGSGTGNLCRALVDELPGTTVVAVDRDPAMAEMFRQKLADRVSAVPRSGRVCFLAGDLMDVFPVLAEHGLRPDYAFLVNVLYLLDDPAGVLRAIAGCLRPGGELRVSNPDERTDLEALLRQFQQDLLHDGRLAELGDDFEVLKRFNRQELSSALHRLSGADIRRLLLESGFRITRGSHRHYAGQSLLLSART